MYFKNILTNEMAKIRDFLYICHSILKAMREFEENDNQLVNEFKESVDAQIEKFYDADEFEIIIEELIHVFDFEYLEVAVERAIQLYPQTSTFRLYKVKVHILKFELDIAEEELDRIEKEFDATPEYYMERVYLCNILNKKEDCIKLLKKALKLAPEEPDIHFLLGFEYLKMKRYDDALTHSIEALRRDDTFEEQLSIYSFVFEEEKLYEEALTFYTALTEEFPFAGAAWFGLGLSYSWLDRYEDSIEAYKMALTCDDEIGTAYFNIGNSYFELKNFENAIEFYESAHNLDPADFHSLSNIGDCYTLTGNTNAALEYYRKTLDINPNHNEAIIGIANILQKDNKEDEARVFIEKAFTNTPQDLDLLFQSLQYYSEDDQVESMINLIDLTLNQLEDYTDFFKYLSFFCATNEFYEIGYVTFDYYSNSLSDEKLPKMMPYYAAAFYFLSDNIELGKIKLADALLLDYENHTEFLAISPILETFDEVQSLIQLYHP